MQPGFYTLSDRDLRLDFFRGIALITIFINHIPGTVFENFTSRNFGFSDAAEAFVLMSGVAAGFAYTKISKSDLLQAFKKTISRAFKLYWVHLLTSGLALLAVFSLTDLLSGEVDFSPNNMLGIQTDTARTLAGLVLLTHQFGYLNVLPLYCVLILLSPLFIRLATKSTALALTASVTLWLIVGLAHFNFPNYPGDGDWFLNPLSWQLIFMIGIIIGVSRKEKRPVFRYNRLVYGLCVAYLVGACAVVQLELWNYVVFLGFPEVIGQYSKTYASLPRLLHICALAYVIIHTNLSKTVANLRASSFIVRLGSNSLPVFATGSVLCIVGQVVKNTFPLTTLEDALLISLGLTIQFLVAISMAGPSTINGNLIKRKLSAPA